MYILKSCSGDIAAVILR